MHILLLLLPRNVNNLWQLVKVIQHDVLSPCVCLQLVYSVYVFASMTVSPPQGVVCVSECVHMYVCEWSIFRSIWNRMYLGKRYEFSRAGMILRVSSLSFSSFFPLLYHFLSLLFSLLFQTLMLSCSSCSSFPSLAVPFLERLLRRPSSGKPSLTLLKCIIT